MSLFLTILMFLQAKVICSPSVLLEKVSSTHRILELHFKGNLP